MTAPSGPKRGFPRLVRRWWWVPYLLLVVASNLWPREPEAPPPLPAVDVPAMADGGPIDGRRMRVAYAEWPARGSARAPVILIHGSPGAGADFGRMGPIIAQDGRRVVAPDLPGFGQSDRDPARMSIASHAHAVLALMDGLEIGRAHVVGWSLGGGVALHMADMAPERLASLTLMASVGTQEDEGSGSYAFEHARYALGWLLATGVRYGVPHFGALDGMDIAIASTRNFWESDQRPLRAIMERLHVPAMVLAGRHDFLVRDWAAQRGHEIIPTSRLVVMDAMHFMPFIEAEESSGHLLGFFRRHDEPGVPALRFVADLSPRPPPILGRLQARFERAMRGGAWWALAAAVALLALWKDRLGLALATLAVAAGKLDYGVALAGLVAGQGAAATVAWGRGRRGRASGAPVLGNGLHAQSLADWGHDLREYPVISPLGARLVPGAFATLMEAWGRLGGPRPLVAAGALVAMLLRPAAWFILGTVVYLLTADRLAAWAGVAGFVIAAAFTVAAPAFFELLVTRAGRRLVRMRFGRMIRREFWPAAVMYLPLAPHLARLAARHGGPLTFTACNPGIPGGGGIIGESKKAIMDAMPDDAVLASEMIGGAEDAEGRARRALDAVASRPELGGYPVILKPDSGYRGFAVRLARDEEAVRSYFRAMTAPAIVQRYHPGPLECGVLWARRPDRGFENNGELCGSIFSICRKDFPVVVGDGRRTLEELIQTHPRFRHQAAVFLERWAPQRRRVLGAGERLRLAESGNHCQGTLFRDGVDLITPALEARFDQIARRFASGAGGVGGVGGLDIGRFDVRYTSDQELREGRGFAILELNGTTGESTNIYDPERSAAWAYGVLARQWTLMYELGARRKAMGARATTVKELVGHARRHFGTRAGSALAD